MKKMSTSDEYREFLCNTILIKALVQFIPVSERKRAQDWLVKLQEIQDGMPDSKIRNEYAFYLLTNVQNGTLSQPFQKAPPSGKLKPLCRILPDFLYDEVMKQLRLSYCKLNKMLSTNNDTYEVPELKCEPGTFHGQQPRPRKGVTALCAVFSNYEDDTPNSK